jgi:ABC-type branched-subunit amino acid transport system permease subunit
VILEARLADQRRPRHFGAAAGDFRLQLRQRCRLHLISASALPILTLFATLNIRRSRVGRAFVAIRDNDTAARVMGINLHAYKLFAFVTSAFITGSRARCMASISPLSASKAFRSCSRSKRWRS